MKNQISVLIIIFALFCISCSEDGEQPGGLTIETRMVQSSSMSLYLYPEGEVTEGLAHLTIQEEGEPALTAAEIKEHISHTQAAVKGVGPFLASFNSLASETSYIIYAYLEINGKAGKVATTKIVTP